MAYIMGMQDWRSHSRSVSGPAQTWRLGGVLGHISPQLYGRSAATPGGFSTAGYTVGSRGMQRSSHAARSLPVGASGLTVARDTGELHGAPRP